MPDVNIYNRFLADVSWSPLNACDFDISGATNIWRINISTNLPHLAKFSSVINPAETGRANRYLHQKDKNRFVISRAALRITLGRYLNCPPQSIEFFIGPNKKPFLKDSPLQYNVSHAGDWIVIAVSDAPIGTDVELINPGFDYHDIISEYFSAEEIDYIDEKDRIFRFFLLWTRKEALTKATAKGLDDDLKYIPALNGLHTVDGELIKSGTDIQVTSFPLDGDHIAAVATPNAAVVRFIDPDFLDR